MKLLVLGGTQFLGRQVVTTALDRGHTLTILHRGRTNPGLFDGAGVIEVLADRDGGLAALGADEWDAVVDTSGYVPRVVRDSARTLASRCGHYAFVSSVSVYADMASPIDENTAVAELHDPTVEEVDGSTYGPLKVACERVVEEEMPGRAAVVRPGLIVGPFDPTDRFTYWPVRSARGGEILGPGDPDRPVQIIDGRDLALWLVDLAERRVAGVFNAVGPNEPLTFGGMIDACLAGTGAAGSVRWVDDEFLLEGGVTPWSELPCWIPASAGRVGMQQVDTRKAAEAGLTHRPASVIAADTLAWHTTREGPTLQATLTAEKEAALLSAAQRQNG